MEQAFVICSIQIIEQVLLFLHKAGFGSFSFKFAKDFLLRKTLFPEHNQGVNLFVSLHHFDTFASLSVELIDKHFN